MPSRAIWFPAKRYGWGWGLPVAWQGWVVLVGWVIVLTVGTSVLAGRHWAGFAIFLVVMGTGLIGICWWKGERPRWRWGE